MSLPRDAQVVFSHPAVTPNKLVLTIKPDQITWAYGLNTSNYDTYGGEVVQILSMFFDDMTISGTCRSYSTLEQIYAWFLQYMQIATQGNKGKGSYNARPVIFSYPHRGWEFSIYPKSLPGFRYGTEVVAPTWTVQAAVVEAPADLKSLIMSEAAMAGTAIQGEFEPFGKATAMIGYYEDNPWSGVTDQAYQKGAVKDQYSKLADYYNNLIPAWLESDDFHALSANYSKPAFLNPDKSPTAPGNRGTRDAKKIAQSVGAVDTFVDRIKELITGRP